MGPIRAKLLRAQSCSASPSGSQRISDGEFSDYDCEDGIGVISGELHASWKSSCATPSLCLTRTSCPDYRQNGRDFHSSTLSVPEQGLLANHSARSDMVRMRSRSPSQPPPHRYARVRLPGLAAYHCHYKSGF